jgi:hypothetical protein
MSAISLQELLFWIALVLSPPDTSQILVKGPEGTWAWTRQASAWSFSEDRSLWSVKGNSVLKAVGGKTGEIDLGDLVAGVREHDWTKAAALKLSGGDTLSKTDKGFIFHHEGTPHLRSTIRYRRAAGALSAPAFGPVIERVPGDYQSGKEWMLNLDTGELFSPPPELNWERDAEAVWKWAERHGVGLTGLGVVSQQGLYGFRTKGAYFLDQGVTFDSVTPEIVRACIESGRSVAQASHNDGPMLSFFGDRNDPGRLYAFQTAAGGQGVLQLLAVGKQPPTLKLRYKLVSVKAPQPQAPAAESAREAARKAQSTLAPAASAAAATPNSPSEPPTPPASAARKQYAQQVLEYETRQLARVQELHKRHAVAEDKWEQQQLKVAEARMHLVEATEQADAVAAARKQYAEQVLEYETGQLARLQEFRKSHAVAQDEVERQQLKVAEARMRLVEATGSGGAIDLRDKLAQGDAKGEAGGKSLAQLRPEHAEADARRDLERNTPKYFFVGRPIRHEENWRAILQRDYNVELVTLGCVAAPPVGQYATSYNAVVLPGLKKKYGQDFLESSEAKARSEFDRTRPQPSAKASPTGQSASAPQRVQRFDPGIRVGPDSAAGVPDLSSPKQAAIAFAKAVAAGDLKSARSLAIGTDAEFAVWKSMSELLQASKRLQAVATKRFGEFPPQFDLNFWEHFADQYEPLEEKIEGDRAYLVRKTDRRHYGPTLKRVGDGWKIDLSGTAKRLTQLEKNVKTAKAMDAVAKNLESGKYQNVNEALEAWRAEVRARLSAAAPGK